MGRLIHAEIAEKVVIRRAGALSEKSSMQTLIDVELEYQKMVDYHASVNRSNRETGIETVLRFLYENKEKKTWWWSWEFIGRVNSKGGYLSHRAPARASDLALHFPTLVEDRKIGRFAIYRLRTENIKEVEDFLKITV